MNEQDIKAALGSVSMKEETKRAIKTALENEAAKPARRPVRRGVFAAAACLLAVALAFGVWRIAGQTPKTPSVTPTEQVSPTDGTSAGKEAPDAQIAPTQPTQQWDVTLETMRAEGDPAQVESPNHGMGNLWALGPGEEPSVHWRILERGEGLTDTGKYPCPGPGTHAYSLGLSKALEDYAGRDDVNYYVRLDVYRYTAPDGNGVACRDLSSEEALAFYDALRERYYESVSIDEVGFEISSAMLWGVTKSVTLGAMAYDAAFFDHFPDLPDVGVFVSLYDEQTEIK